jgi:hypothetical protein
MLNRTCEICGGRVTNINPKVTTCGPICTEAKRKGRTHKHQMRVEADKPSKEKVSCSYCGGSFACAPWCPMYHEEEES